MSQCEPYVTIQEFKDSPFFCQFPTCCISGSIDLDTYIEAFIDLTKAEFDSYLGWEICLLDRKESFRGEGDNIIFTTYTPIDEETEITLNEIYYTESGKQLKECGKAFVETPEIGSIVKPSSFSSTKRYQIEYKAGFDPIPDDIKQAFNMMILNLAQRLDNNNANNPDLSIDSINISKTATANFGSSKMVKQVVMKSMRELCDLPVPVARILDRYRMSGGL